MLYIIGGYKYIYITQGISNIFIINSLIILIELYLFPNYLHKFITKIYNKHL